MARSSQTRVARASRHHPHPLPPLVSIRTTVEPVMGEYFELDRRTGFSGFSDVEVLPKDNASSKRGSQQKLELASQNRNPGSFWAFLPVFPLLRSRKDSAGFQTWVVGGGAHGETMVWIREGGWLQTCSGGMNPKIKSMCSLL